MPDQLKPLYEMLCGRFGWLPQVFVIYTALVTAFGFVQVRVQKYFEAQMEDFAKRPDSFQSYQFERMLCKPWWVTLNFLCHFINLWIPSVDDYRREKARFVTSVLPATAPNPEPGTTAT